MNLPSVTLLRSFLPSNELTIGIMAVVAQAERKMIAERKKAAKQRAKANGRTFGNLESLPEASRKGTAAVKERSQRLKMNVLPVIREIQSIGVNGVGGYRWETERARTESSPWR